MDARPRFGVENAFQEPTKAVGSSDATMLLSLQGAKAPLLFSQPSSLHDTHVTMRRVFVPSVAALILAAAVLLALPAPSAAECARFCAQIPPEELETAELTRCDTCGDDLEYDGSPCAAPPCCAAWCEWVPLRVQALVSRCEDCSIADEEEESRSRGCLKPSWCNFIPTRVQELVGPCATSC